MTAIAILALVLVAHPAAAQQRARCRECDTLPRDSIRIRISPRVATDADLERLARELEGRFKQLEALKVQVIADSAANHPDHAEMARRISSRIQEITRQTLDLRAELQSACRSQPRPEGWLGVNMSGPAMITRRGNEAPTMVWEGYPVVEAVEPGSPAAQSGIEAGDQLLTISNHDMRDASATVIGSLLKPGAKLPLRIRRGGETKELTVVVAPLPSGMRTQCPWLDQSLARALVDAPIHFEMIRPSVPGTAAAAPRQPTTPSQRRVEVYTTTTLPALPPVATVGAINFLIAGAQLTAMNADLGDVLGVSRGAFVVNVGQGTPAFDAGLKGGDVITEAGGLPVNSPADLQRRVREARDHELKLRVVRKKKTQTLTLKWSEG